jgi:hypothetical protein
MDLSSLVIQILPVLSMGMICLSAFCSIWCVKKVISLSKDDNSGGGMSDYKRGLHNYLKDYEYDGKHDPYLEYAQSYAWQSHERTRKKKKKADWKNPQYGYGTKFFY